MKTILSNKYYNEPSIFLPENLLRESRRQKNKKDCNIASICLLDPDGDLSDYLIKNNLASINECWACYHSKMYSYKLDGLNIGIVPCIVGASYAVLVAEQLFVSGCKLLISITSAGIINRPDNNKRFVLIVSSIRDEGTSYHYLPPGKPSLLKQELFHTLYPHEKNSDCPYFGGTSWTTDSPFRETQSAIAEMKKENITCVEMEAAALYALSEAKKFDIICFAHLTNSMAQTQGDFEKGEESGSIDTLNLVSYVLNMLGLENIV